MELLQAVASALSMIIATLLALTHAQAMSGPLLMKHPTVNQTTIVFSFAGELWSVPKAGGAAHQLTTGEGTKGNPCFSPDGKWIAFTGNYDGNTNVFVIPAEGGVPKRLTYEPNFESVTGWTKDGKNVLFISDYHSNTDMVRMFTVPVTGGMPKPLPFPSGTYGSFSPDGDKIAYVPNFQWQQAWKRYRGGQTTPIWIGDLSDSKVKEIPRNNSNDTFPMWVGDKIFFLSDRKGPFSLWAYDTNTGDVAEKVPNTGFDFKSADEGAGQIVYEQLGSIHLYDIKSGEEHKVPISIAGDFPEVRPEFKNVSPLIFNADISATGQRALFEARGEIWSVPGAKGDIRNLTNSPGVADRMPSWSPDGQSVAYLSDKGGDYQLVVEKSNGEGQGKSYRLGDPPAYYYNPLWSPDSKKITYSDNRHNMWVLDVATGSNTKIDTNPWESVLWKYRPSWSPDSKWIAYARELESHMGAIFLYNLDTKSSTQLTDGLGYAASPVFDKNGKYLYFVASTNVAQAYSWLDLSSYGNLNSQYSPYVCVLRKDLPSPLEPQSDEEKIKEEPKPETPTKDPGRAVPPPATPPTNPQPSPDQPKATPPETKAPTFSIDLDRIGQRVLALPMEPALYTTLYPAGEGSFLAMRQEPIATVTSSSPQSLVRFSMDERAASPFAGGVQYAAVSSDGKKALLFSRGSWSIVSTDRPPQPGQGRIDVSGMVMKVNPREEWKQMFHEAWRIQRDFFYSPTFNGQNLTALEKRYEPFLDGVMTRNDLNYLFTDMLGEMTVGHMFISGGDIPEAKRVTVGLLGADYTVENGHYRFSRVYNGENWNPDLQAPLTQPGVNVMEGEYLLEIDGKPITADDNLNERLEGTAGRQVRIKVGPNPNATGAREVVVVPITDEFGLRNKAWEEDNRRLVDKLSGGRLGYVHIPDTNIGGWTNFNRYYYAQVGREGMIVDERFNHGGQVDDFMVQQMARPLLSYWTPRYGKDYTSPLAQIYGPKVMVINQYSGSGGDYFPWAFRQYKLGPIVGHRTWGGLVGILVFPTFIDGGSVTSPNIAFRELSGKFGIENVGVPPDIPVELDPALWRQGKDAQLEAAIAEAMRLLEKTPKRPIPTPEYLDKSKLGG